MIKKLLATISYLGLSFKKELLVFIIINLTLIASLVLLIVFDVTKFIIFIYATSLPFIDFFYLSRYKDLKRKVEENHNGEFVSLLSYFEIFISNHANVYKSLEMLIPYASDWMKMRLENLLAEIDLDKSVIPYIRFSKNFTYLVIENVMVSIYQMVEHGESEESLTQFDFVFTSLNNTLISEKVLNHTKNIENLNAFPLFGAGLIVITLTLSIMSILGDLTNVI